MRLRTRIIISVLICFIAVWLPSVIILFSYMNNEVYRLSRDAVSSQMESAVSSVNDELFAIIDAVAWISDEKSVSDAFAFSSLDDRGAAVAVFEAQQRIAAYMAASPASEHLNKIVLFSPGKDISFEFVRWRSGTLYDADAIIASDSFRNLSFPEGVVVSMMFGRTINDPSAMAIIAYGRVRNTEAYIYAEISADILSPIIEAYPGYAYAVSESGSYPEEVPSSFLNSSSYAVSSYGLAIPGAAVLLFQERMPLSLMSSSGLAVLLVVSAASILLFILLSFLLSRYLTRVSSRLVRHIEYLMDTKDFGYVDKTMEKGDEEIASIAHAVNAMSISISELLKRNEALFEDKKRMEIDMLQMQVNPHFLYNTLESMHYLAEVQRNEGIARMSRGLSTLLRNMAKGSSDQITLAEELSLLGDYDSIQQVRYMGMYEIEYDVPDDLMGFLIQKFTLQPLVENAIFHGIEPSGRCGTIRISAVKEGDDLCISVCDDGVGMDADGLVHILDVREHSKTDMTGVGLRNINERIKLVYGRECGLSFESEKGRYMKVTVRIKAVKGGV